MNRRTLLAAGTGLAATATAVTACDDDAGKAGGDTSPAGSSSSTSDAHSASASGSRPAVDGKPKSADWSALGKDLQGDLVRPADSDYTSASRLYNTRFDHLRPAAVAYIENTSDISACLDFARRHGAPSRSVTGVTPTPAGRAATAASSSTSPRSLRSARPPARRGSAPGPSSSTSTPHWARAGSPSPAAPARASASRG
ncbi:hypothetical protein SVIO_060280 [Streptomyces violaceusniger]|uniref:Uncharacterized protein n=1 Tax=Streptomyces violaceusniger TaxID=68280 RepID=A0A4D4L2R8_STRVO|nr:hypothetical protein SVIO_060280 [Streptomyces violaceusniger]